MLNNNNNNDDDDDDDNNNNNNLLSGKSQLSVLWQTHTRYVASAVREASSVAEQAASKKMDKFTGLAVDYHFQPIAVEMFGPINESASH